MKTISMRLEDATVEILDEKAKQQNMTVSEYLRQQIFPLIEGTKPLTLEQCLEKLERSLGILQLCVKPLQELVFDLQKFEVQQEAELIVEQEKEKILNEQPKSEPEIKPETA